MFSKHKCCIVNLLSTIIKVSTNIVFWHLLSKNICCVELTLVIASQAAAIYGVYKNNTNFLWPQILVLCMNIAFTPCTITNFAVEELSQFYEEYEYGKYTQITLSYLVQVIGMIYMTLNAYCVFTLFMYNQNTTTKESPFIIRSQHGNMNNNKRLIGYNMDPKKPYNTLQRSLQNLFNKDDDIYFDC